MRVTSAEARMRRAGGIILIIAVPVAVTAVALHPPHVAGVHSGMLDEVRRHRDAWIAAHLLFLALTILFIPAFLALASIVRETRPGLALAALLAGLLGTVGQMGFLGVDLTIWQMAAPVADSAEMEALVTRIEGSAAISVPLYGLSAGFFASVLMLLYALVHSRSLPAALAVLVAGGLGAAFVFSSGRAVALIGTLLTAPGIVWLGWRITRDPERVTPQRLPQSRAEN